MSLWEICNSLFCRSCLVESWPAKPEENLVWWRNGLEITRARATALSWLWCGRGSCDGVSKMCATVGTWCVSWLGCLFATWWLWCGSLGLELKSQVRTIIRWLKLLTACHRDRQNPSGSITNLFMPRFTCLYNESNDHHVVKGSFVPVVMLAWLMALKCCEWFWWKHVSKCDKATGQCSHLVFGGCWKRSPFRSHFFPVWFPRRTVESQWPI